MRARVLVVLVAVAMAAAACSNSSDSKKSSGTKSTGSTSSTSGGPASTVNQPGVNATTIRVGGVVSKTNPLNAPYDDQFDGVRAYFAMVNDGGGIYGRKLELVAQRDDRISNNQQEVEGLIAQDNIFAALPMATIFSFSGADELVKANVPTFGWNINAEWTGHPNLFGVDYGALCLGCVGASVPFIAQQLHKKKVGVLAYSVDNSARCADGDKASFDRYPSAKVVFLSKSLSFGTTDFSVEVGQMKDKGVDFVLTCMDTTAVLNLAKEMRKQGLNAIQYMPNAYDADFVKANAQFFEGSIVLVPFAPFETKPAPPGLVEYERWIEKQHYKRNENTMYGWLAASMFVDGLKAAGPDFTRHKVIDALNKMKAQTLGGLIPPRDWTTNHEITHGLGCGAYLKIQKGKFVPIFTKPGKPFMCVPDQPAKLPTSATNK